MTPRRLVSAVLVAAVELWLYREYAALGAQFHFWLHGLFGASLGLLALAAWRVARRRLARVAPWEGAFAGHLLSAVPDVLFLGFGVLHLLWMDVFALHISLHFVPAPLPTQVALFCLALAAYVLAAEGRAAAAGLAAGAVVAVTGGALLLRAPLPTTLAEVRAAGADGPAAAPWLCPALEGLARDADHGGADHGGADDGGAAAAGCCADAGGTCAPCG